MKFLLTSNGISNKTIENELKYLIGKDFKGLKMLFCITASNYEGGEMNDWLIKDLQKLTSLGFKIDVCDINGVSKDNFLPRFEWQMYSILKVEIHNGLEIVLKNQDLKSI